MFRTELLRIKYRKGKAYPGYIDISYKDLIEELLSILKENITVGEFNDELKYLKKAYDPKLIDGISTILLRKVNLENRSPIDPKIIRAKVFSYGPIVDDNKKEEIMKKIKEELGFDPIKYMFADLDDEMVIKSIPKINIDDIIKEYNFELLQTALMKTLRVNIYISERWKDLLFNTKRLGLMYNAYENPFRIEIFGPASMLRFTERYGRNISMLLPYIVSNRSWKINAEFVGKYNRAYILEASNNDAEFPNEIYQSNISFDSSIEKDFYSKIKIVAKDWKIIREPQPLVVNNMVFIPDFLLSKNNVNIYVEIIGFWTKEYLKRKAEKVNEVKLPIILIVDDSLGYEEFNSENLIRYKKTINIAAVYHLINKLYDNIVKNLQISQNSKNIKISKDVVSYEELSKEYGIPKEMIKQDSINIEGYIKLKNYIIRRDLIEDFKKINFENNKISFLTKQYGDWIIDLLDFLGYKIKWINVTDAVVIRT